MSTTAAPASTPKIEIKADCLKRLSNLDRIFLQIEDPTQLMTIAGMWIFQETPAEEAVLLELEKWIAMFPTFRSRVEGREWKEVPNYNVRDNFVVADLPSPGGKKELEDYISIQMGTPFDFSKPLWKAHLVRGFNGGGAAYFVTLHHCISDGQGTIRMILSLTTDSAEEKLSGAGHTVQAKPKRRESPIKKSQIHLENFIKTMPLGEQVVNLLLALHVLPLLALFLAGIEFFLFYFIVLYNFLAKWTYFLLFPKRVLTRKGTPHKNVAYSDLLDLEEVKEVGRKVDATVNDVLISTLTRSLRRYLDSTNELHKEREIHCLVPVSVRSPDDWSLGNKVTANLLQLPIHIPDAVQCLKTVKSRLDGMKVSQETHLSYFFLSKGISFMPSAIMDLSINTFKKKYHAVLTNVPGPKNQIKFAGMPVKEYHSFIPQPSNGGLGLCVLSYNGKVSLSVNSDAGQLIPSASGFLKYFNEEFEILKKKLLSSEKPSPKSELSPSPEPSPAPSQAALEQRPEEDENLQAALKEEAEGEEAEDLDEGLEVIPPKEETPAENVEPEEGKQESNKQKPEEGEILESPQAEAEAEEEEEEEDHTEVIPPKEEPLAEKEEEGPKKKIDSGFASENNSDTD